MHGLAITSAYNNEMWLITHALNSVAVKLNHSMDEQLHPRKLCEFWNLCNWFSSVSIEYRLRTSSKLRIITNRYPNVTIYIMIVKNERWGCMIGAVSGVMYNSFVCRIHVSLRWCVINAPKSCSCRVDLWTFKMPLGTKTGQVWVDITRSRIKCSCPCSLTMG